MNSTTEEVIEYAFVSGHSYTEFVHDVNREIQKGFQPFGGISTTMISASAGGVLSKDGDLYMLYTQALVRYKKHVH